MSDDLSLTVENDDVLLQPDFADDGVVPPTYSPGNLPDVTPVEAIRRAKDKFYGPVEGPFACQIPGDILQVPPDWTGYIRKDAKGNLLPVHATAFERVYEIYGEPVAGDTSDNAIIAELVGQNDEITDKLAMANAELDEARKTIENLQAELDGAQELLEDSDTPAPVEDDDPIAPARTDDEADDLPDIPEDDPVAP